MADLYEKSISRWEGEGGFTVPTDGDYLEESNHAAACSWCDRGIWLKALAVTGAVALLIYALSSRSSTAR